MIRQAGWFLSIMGIALTIASCAKVDRGEAKREADSLFSLANRFVDSLMEFEKAIGHYEAALSVYRSIEDSQDIGRVYENLGGAYNLNDQYAKAISCFDSSLSYYQTLGDLEGETYVLNALGEAYQNVNQYEKAFEHLERALKAVRVLGNEEGEGVILHNLALNYSYLGQYQRAIELELQAVTVLRKVGNTEGEGGALMGLGFSYSGLQQFEKSVKYYRQALPLFRDDRKTQGAILGNLMKPYNGLGEYAKAIQVGDSALAIALAMRSRIDEGVCYSKLGLVYLSSKQYRRSIDYLQKAVVLFRELKTPEREAIAYSRLMDAYKSLGNLQASIWYGKQAVNIFQEIRGAIKGLGKRDQEEYLKSREPTYRELIELFFATRRTGEALQLLGMLKDEEYFEYLEYGREDSLATSELAANGDEGSWKLRFEEIRDTVASIGKAWSELGLKKTRTPGEQSTYEKLGMDLVVANKAYEAFLDHLELETKRWNQTGIPVETMRVQEQLKQELRALGDGAVALYTFVGDDKLRIIMMTPEVLKADSFRIRSSDLISMVQRFRKAIDLKRSDKTSARDILLMGQEFYTIIVAPIASNLRAARAKTLIWSLDGILRYLPISALYDGDSLMVERFANVVFTLGRGFSYPSTGNVGRRALGLGVSKGWGEFPPLDNVSNELHGIIRDMSATASTGILPGEIRLDEKFTRYSMEEALQQDYSYVHIATHFELKPGNVKSSFLLLGDGSHFTLDQFKTLPGNPFDRVELLTLSACNTAVGGTAISGKEIGNLGFFAQQKGAQAVIASLWPVRDKSTSELMRTLYQFLEDNPKTSKAEALRQSQLSLLYDKLPTQERTRDRLAPYAHPYYWAPFVLFGNSN